MQIAIDFTISDKKTYDLVQCFTEYRIIETVEGMQEHLDKKFSEYDVYIHNYEIVEDEVGVSEEGGYEDSDFDDGSYIERDPYWNCSGQELCEEDVEDTRSYEQVIEDDMMSAQNSVEMDSIRRKDDNDYKEDDWGADAPNIIG